MDAANAEKIRISNRDLGSIVKSLGDGISSAKSDAETRVSNELDAVLKVVEKLSL